MAKQKANHPGVICKAAFALLAVSCNFFPDELYMRRGGKKEVKECNIHKFHG